MPAAVQRGDGIGLVAARHDQQEFLAAPADDLVAGAQACGHGPGHRGQHLVARGMAKAVVDLLEIVDIDQRQRQCGADRARLGDGFLQVQAARGARQRAGQAVVLHLFAKRALRQHLGRDVAHHAHIVRDLAFAVAQRRDALLAMHLRAVGALVDEYLAHRPAVLEPGPEFGVERRLMLTGLGDRRLAAYQFAGAQAGDLFVALVGELDDSQMVADQHAVLGRIERAREDVRRRPGHGQRTQVVLHRNEVGDAPIGVAHRRDVPFKQVGRAVLAVVEGRALEEPAFGNAAAQFRDDHGAGVRALQHARIAPQQFVRRIAGHRAQRGIDIDDAVVVLGGIGDQHGIEGLLDGLQQQGRQGVGRDFGSRWRRRRAGTHADVVVP